MSNFTGSKCIVCDKEFNDNDDIVVCPECGTPYHRECYSKEGRCINTELHESGKSWTDINEQQEDENSRKKCPHCQTLNRPHAIICENCGASLVDGLDFQQNAQTENPDGQAAGMNRNPYGGAAFDPDDKYCGMDPEEKFDDVTLSEAADFIGTNRFYYLTLFKRMKETGKKISLNVICLLFPQFYFANRKMWAETILTVLITVLLSVPYTIYVMYAAGTVYEMPYSFSIDTDKFELMINITNYISLAFRILLCMFANWLYYRHMVKKIKTIKKASGDGALEKIRLSGGTSFANIVIAFGIQFLLTAVAFICFMYLK